MNISSGYTSRLQGQAINCDKARLLARLQNVSPCPMSFPSNSWAPASSVLERKIAQFCGNATDVLINPKKATSSSVHTLSLQTNTILAGSTYIKADPPCSSLTVQTISKNPAIPAASLAECQPSRFF